MNSLSGGALQSNIIRPKRSAVAEAKAMSKSEDSQTSLDQSGNHSLKGSAVVAGEGNFVIFFTISLIYTWLFLLFNFKVYVLCCVFKTLTLDKCFRACFD